MLLREDKIKTYLWGMIDNKTTKCHCTVFEKEQNPYHKKRYIGLWNAITFFAKFL